jgi:hypothetical protein
MMLAHRDSTDPGTNHEHLHGVVPDDQTVAEGEVPR